MLKILFDPAPRTAVEIFSQTDEQRFFADYNVVTVDADSREEQYRQHLPDTDILVSQQPMERDRLDHAARLRAIFNVETNFLANIDYECCFRHGIHVLTPASVFAVPVAEIGLGMALSLARDIHSAHGDFLNATEAYGLSGNQRAELLTGSDIGIVGFGDLGRALKHLLVPFNANIKVYDPWLPNNYLARHGVEAATFKHVLQTSRVVFVTAAVTTENQQLFDATALASMQDNAMLILLSRAALVDFDAMTREAQTGRLRFATDVFPEEPVPQSSPLRAVPNILFSAHRAGALTGALQQIGALMLEDLQQIADGLPPVVCRRAERETISMLRSMPVEQT
jgi:phosphoglycerate dehydrogenase-like enzyme